MKAIVPHFWYDTQAGDAAAYYASLFENSRILSRQILEGTPSGSVELLAEELAGQEFQMMSAGPYFALNPSISLMVRCSTTEETDELWGKLNRDGTVLMPIGSYPFSERYGWTVDRYGLSWQLLHTGGVPAKQKIVPVLLFTGKVCGKAMEAIEFYVSLFPASRTGPLDRYVQGEAPDAPGTLKHGAFTLNGLDFAAMDSAYDHGFAFNEAVSFIVTCDTQDELDRYWNALSADPEAEQCGWTKDRFGVSWQIVPAAMEAMMADPDPAKRQRVTDSMLEMKKLDLAELERAYKG